VELRPNYPVTTSRLRLRPLTADDTPALLAYRGDAEVCRYLPFEPMDEQTLAKRLASDLGRREITADGQSLTLGAELDGTGGVIGDVVLFFHSTQHAGGEIGYVFNPTAAARGYATEACSAVLDLAFDDLGLHRVTARMDARNGASARLAKRLGMRHEAHHRSSEMFKGAWADLDVYAILAQEWRARGDHQHSRTLAST
jgi:RimJ/RimL family protein N-acetyltransferase